MGLIRFNSSRARCWIYLGTVFLKQTELVAKVMCLKADSLKKRSHPFNGVKNSLIRLPDTSANHRFYISFFSFYFFLNNSGQKSHILSPCYK